MRSSPSTPRLGRLFTSSKPFTRRSPRFSHCGTYVSSTVVLTPECRDLRVETGSEILVRLLSPEQQDPEEFQGRNRRVLRPSTPSDPYLHRRRGRARASLVEISPRNHQRPASRALRGLLSLGCFSSKYESTCSAHSAVQSTSDPWSPALTDLLAWFSRLPSGIGDRWGCESCSTHDPR
jgi:hypothetical protein